MTKVVMLSHVKASSAPSTARSSSGRRIPWLGGKIVSNKEEALRKFYERKLNAGGTFNDRQIDALRNTLGITVDKAQQAAQAHMNPKKLHTTHRPRGKVQASSSKTIVINGRIVGPKVTSESSSKALGATRQPHYASSTKFVKAPNKFTKSKASGPSSSSSSGSPLALEDKLHLPLDALVHNKTAGFPKRMRK